MTISNRTAGFIVVALLLFGGWLYLARPEHKYRLTINVETPTGIKSASSVIAVYLGKISWGPVGGGVAAKGDATFLDLGDGRNLIATMTCGDKGERPDCVSYLAMKAFASYGTRISFKDLRNLQGAVPVNLTLLPTLVSFKDPSDVRSLRVVNPNDLSSVFGEGYRLKDASLSMVPVGFWPFDLAGLLGEPVTRGIERKLPWINDWKARGLGGQISTFPDRFTVNVPYFTRR